MEFYPGGVSYDFKDLASYHCSQESPSVVENAESDLHHERCSENSKIECIASKVGNVINRGPCEGASLECAKIGIIVEGLIEFHVDAKAVVIQLCIDRNALTGVLKNGERGAFVDLREAVNIELKARSAQER